MPRSMSQAAWGSMACPHTCISRRTSSITDSEPATAPAMTSVCPLRYLVALWITMSAPCSSGRKLIGDANVESTRRASPSAFASVAIGSRSTTRISGLVGVSTNIARVFLRNASFQARERSGSTKVTSMPKRPNSSVNRRWTPP